MTHKLTRSVAVNKTLQLLSKWLFLFPFLIMPAHAGQMTLAWDASTSSDVGGYYIYYSESSGNYSTSARVDAGNQTRYTVPNLTDGATYYFVATAYNSTRTAESGYSNQVSAAVPSSAAPVASFTASATTGVAPLTVTFNDTSTGSITNREWNLGNGSTPSGPTVTTAATSYATPGSYTVTLKVTGSGGSNTATKTITATAPTTAPVADFNASTTNGTAPMTINFTDASTGTVTAWSWQFGDGGTSSTQSPSHSYAAAGTYTVTLTATGPGGSNTKTKIGYITLASGGGGSGSGTIGLVAAYGFDEVSGVTAVDASGNGNHGTITEATRITSGRFGKALQFDGVNDWVSVNDSASLDLSSQMTLEAWVYPTVWMSGWRDIVMKEQTNGAVYYLCANTDSNQPASGIWLNGEKSLSGVTQVPPNKWAHLAATYDGQYQSLYVNGVLVSMQPQTGSIPASTGKLRIGGNAIWGEYFTGYIDEVRVYNRALSQAEIAADANTAVADATPPKYRVGNQAIASVTDSNPQGTAQAFQATAQSSSLLTQIQVYLDKTSTATKLVAGVYVDASNHPGSRRAQGTLTTLKAGAWNSVAIPPTSIVSGQRYWIAVLSSSGQVVFRVDGGSAGVMETSRSTTLTTLPSTWTTGNIYGNGPMSAFGAGY